MPSVLTLEKSLNVLEAVLRSENGIGTRALAQQLAINVATAHNIATTFVSRGYLRQDKTTRLFFPGMKLMHMGGNHLAYHQFLAGGSVRVVQRISDEINETVQLVVNDQGHFLNLAYVPGKQALAVNDFNEVHLNHAHATAYGKMLLAHFEPALIEGHVRQHGLPALTPYSITDMEVLLRELERVREERISRTQDECVEGVSALAVPVHDSWGAVFAALGVSAPTIRMKRPGYFEKMLGVVRRAAVEIEKLWQQGSFQPPEGVPPGNRRGRPRKKKEEESLSSR